MTLHVKPSRGRASIGSLTIDLGANLARLSADMKAVKSRRTKAPPKHDPFADLCVAAGLPRPVTEYRFHPERRWRFDYALPGRLMIALEVEGGVWTGGRHTRGAGYLGDVDKYNEAALLGWLVLRCTPSKLRTQGLALLQRAVHARAA